MSVVNPRIVSKEENRIARWGIPILVGIVALVVFVFTLAPTVTAEDSGELIAAAWHFGVPHPPGYPLWTLLCGIFTHLVPIGSIAFRANLFSAVCSAGAAMVVYAALRELKLSQLVCASASLVFVWCRWSWSQSVITEVYGLNTLLTATIFWCGLRWYATRDRKILVWASLFLGLGMSNHHTIGLCGLAVAVWILLQQPALLKQWRLILLSTSAFIVGLLPYIYLPISASADPVINWGDPSTPQRFWEHVSRDQYGALGPMKVVEPTSAARLSGQIRYLTDSLVDDMTVYLAIASLGGLVLMVAQRKWRWPFVLVVLWVACTGILFALLANYDLDRTSRWAMRVFLIPVPLGFVVALAVFMDWIIRIVRDRLSGKRVLAMLLVGAIVLAGPASQVVSHWRQCDYSNYWYAYDHAQNMLECMLPNSMIFPSGDHSAFPLVYLVLVEEKRPDVLIADIYGYVSPELYKDRPVDSQDSPLTWVIKKGRRPVYFTTKKASPVPNVSWEQAGILYHLLPEGMPFDNEEILEKCNYRNISDSCPGVVDFGADHILCDYEFFMGLEELEKGLLEPATRHFISATGHGSGIKEVFNNIGSALGEHGFDENAIEYFKQAASLDTRYALPRWNLFRTYKVLRDWPQAKYWLKQIIAATPDDYRAYGEMGFVQEQLGNTNQAVDYWQESLRLNPAQYAIVDALSRTTRSE